jgi:hypothetical protein
MICLGAIARANKANARGVGQFTWGSENDVGTNQWDEKKSARELRVKKFRKLYWVSPSMLRRLGSTRTILARLEHRLLGRRKKSPVAISLLACLIGIYMLVFRQFSHDTHESCQEDLHRSWLGPFASGKKSLKWAQDPEYIVDVLDTQVFLRGTGTSQRYDTCCKEKGTSSSPCVYGGFLYKCTFYPGTLQMDESAPAPSHECLPGQCSWNVCSEGKYLCWESVSRRGISLEKDFACCLDKNTTSGMRTQTFAPTVTPGMSMELTKEYRTRVLVVQTVAPGKYFKLFNSTVWTNKRWARAQGYDFLSAIGVYHGQNEWQSTFNKVFLLRHVYESMLSDYDLLFYLDADVLVQNPYFCVEHFLSPNHLLGAHAGTGKHGTRWNKNAGVVLYNLRHPMMGNFSKAWSDQSEADINDGNDQDFLHGILTEYGKTMQLDALLPVLPNEAPMGQDRGGLATHTAHIKRPDYRDWTGNSVDARVKIAEEIAAKIEWPNGA